MQRVLPTFYLKSWKEALKTEYETLRKIMYRFAVINCFNQVVADFNTGAEAWDWINEDKHHFKKQLLSVQFTDVSTYY